MQIHVDENQSTSKHQCKRAEVPLEAEAGVKISARMKMIVRMMPLILSIIVAVIKSIVSLL